MKKTLNGDLPLVSILCITYNHVEYIRETLDSFLMQKTKFNYEILISDDASNDGTVDILKEYQQKYPDIIRLVLHDKNEYSQGMRGMFAKYLFPIARGRYIALCEGDDYWTDVNKIQLQVDFLEKNQDYAVCFHKAKVIYENNERPQSVYPREGAYREGKSIPLLQLLRENMIPTNSVLYRKYDYSNLKTGLMPGDWYMHLYHAQFGKIGFLDLTMAVYRRHESGIWWHAESNSRKLILEQGPYMVAFQSELLRMFGKNNSQRSTIEQHFGSCFNDLLDVQDAHMILSNAVMGDSITASAFVKFVYDRRKEYESEIQELNNIRVSEGEKVEKLINELKEIKSSKLYRISVLIGSLFKRQKL